MAGSALMWSYGAAVQDENENVTINSPETIAAVEFMTQLFEGAMSDEVFGWNAASNNQGLVAGQLSFILNSISAWRTAQDTDPDDRRRHLLRPRPRGAGDGDRGTARALQLDRPDPRREPGYGQGVPAPLHGELRGGDLRVEALRLPGLGQPRPRPRRVAHQRSVQRQAAGQARVLTGATDWRTNIGHPGPASPAVARDLQHLRGVEHARPRRPRGSRPPPSRSPKPRRSATTSSTSGATRGWWRQRSAGRPSDAGAGVEVASPWDSADRRWPMSSRSATLSRSTTAAACGPSMGSTWRPRRASSSSCSGRRAAARRPCCG